MSSSLSSPAHVERVVHSYCLSVRPPPRSSVCLVGWLLLWDSGGMAWVVVGWRWRGVWLVAVAGWCGDCVGCGCVVLVMVAGSCIGTP